MYISLPGRGRQLQPPNTPETGYDIPHAPEARSGAD